MTSNSSNNYNTFEDVKQRLDEIVASVSDGTMPLDDALALYEEAVSLGLRASDLLEEHIEAYNEHVDAQSAEQAAANETADQAATQEAAEPVDKPSDEQNVSPEKRQSFSDEHESLRPGESAES